MSIISTDLLNEVLIEPIRMGADKIYIVSGYATPTMVSRHLELVKSVLHKQISIHLIVGMCPKDGMLRSQHLGFQKLQTPIYGLDFSCNYIIDRPAVHSKVYAWTKDGSPFLGYVGSANYTQNAFSSQQRETLVQNNANDCYSYYQSLLGETANCADANIEDHISFYDRITHVIENNPVQTTVEGLSPSIVTEEKVTLPLLKRNGDIQETSALNWGQRANRNRNEAYIPVPAEIGRSSFFPEEKKQFMVLTDDNKQFICVVAQQGRKAIETPLNNSFLGEYFRYRLGLSNGAFVTKEDLLRYGRTDVDFYKLDEETYYLDFSVQS